MIKDVSIRKEDHNSYIRQFTLLRPCFLYYSLYSAFILLIVFVVRLKSADDDMDVDVVGSGEESLNQSNVTNDEVDISALGENSLTLEKLLQDLETSPQHDESDESGDDDFPFDDGDDDDVEDEEEPGDEERQDETIEDTEDNGDDTSRDTTE